MKNAEVLLKNGHDFTELDIESYGRVSANAVSYKIYLNDKCIDTVTIDHVGGIHAILVWLNKEYGPKILDDIEKEYLRGILTAEEKEYLSVVIKPFRDRIRSISKEQLFDDDVEHLWFAFNDDSEDEFCLPSFKAGTAYRGMVLYHYYTLKDLGL